MTRRGFFSSLFGMAVLPFIGKVLPNEEAEIPSKYVAFWLTEEQLNIMRRSQYIKCRLRNGDKETWTRNELRQRNTSQAIAAFAAPEYWTNG